MKGNELAKSFYLVRKFEELKLKQHQSNSVLSRLLSLYRFHSPISKRIIFHSLSQSWILALTKQFKNKLIEEANLEFNLVSFEELFVFFVNTTVNITFFYENMKKCVYRANHTTMSLMEFKLAQVFIEKIEDNKKRQCVIGDTYPNTKIDFEERMMKLLLITVNYTLNEIDSQEENKTNLFLYKTFNFICSKELSKTCKYQLFMNQVIKEKENKKTNSLIEMSINNNSSSNNKAQAQVQIEQCDVLYYIKLAKLFYAIANTNYTDLLSDVKYFVFINSAWNQKLELIIKSIVNNKQNVVFRFAYFSIKNVIEYISQTHKSISRTASVDMTLGSKKKKKETSMSITNVIYKGICGVHSVISNIIDWNVGKLNDIKNNTCYGLYSLFVNIIKPSWFEKANANASSNNNYNRKMSICDKCSGLYLSHFSFEYESTGSRSNSVISDI